MSTLKHLTTTLTAAFLVGGIGLAVAQSEETPPATEPTVAAPLPSEQTPPADPTAMPQESNTALQQQPAADPARTTPQPADNSTMQSPPQQPATDTMSQPAPSRTPAVMPAQAYTEPAPRADRN